MPRTTPTFPHIAVCGPLAAGKTSLVRLLAASLGWHAVYEDLTAQAYFKDFYGDMNRWGFHVAVSFLVKAIELEAEVESLLADRPVCQDWFVREHHEVYNYHMLHSGILDGRDYAVCDRLHGILMSRHVGPDLIVYLRVSPRTVAVRTKSRRRKGEAWRLPGGYAAKLVERYEAWIPTVDRVLQLDAERLNFVKSETDKATVVRLVRDRLELS